MDLTPTTYRALFNLLSDKGTDVLRPQKISFVKPNHRGAISVAAAQKLFNAFARLEDLHFEAYQSECNTRAALMANILNTIDGLQFANVYTNKIGITKKQNPIMAEWEYHVAPCVFLQRMSEMAIIDPALSHRFLTLDEWRQKINAEDGSIEIQDAYITLRVDDGLARIKKLSQEQTFRMA